VCGRGYVLDIEVSVVDPGWSKWLRCVSFAGILYGYYNVDEQEGRLIN
jgi:hypothetical protein